MYNSTIYYNLKQVHKNIIIIGDLLETHQRPIRDPSETYRRPFGDPSETHIPSWRPIGDQHA